MLRLELSRRSRASDESGVVMLLLAMTALVIFAMVSLAIDTSIITTSRAHFRLSGELAVLGALERMSEGMNAKLGVDASTTAAQTKAQDSLRDSFVRNPGRSFQVLSGNTQDALSLDCSAQGENGCLRRINWYFPDTSTTCPANPMAEDPFTVNTKWRPCPCDQACECAEGCDRDPVTLGEAGNGLRLSYRTATGSPIRGFFRNIISRVQSGSEGQNSDVNFEVVSRAVIVPRNAVMTVDLSPSIASLPSAQFRNPPWTSYPNPPPTPTLPIHCDRVQYVYDMEAGATCNANDPEFLKPPGIKNPFTLTYAMGDEGKYGLCVYRANYETSPPATVNRVNEYSCINFAGADAIRYYGGTTETTSFLVNVNPAIVVEPLTSVLTAINRSLVNFQTRSVPGDRVGIFAFDSDWIDNRILGEAKNDVATIRPSRLNTVEYGEFITATDTSIPITDQRRWSKFLFPRNFVGPDTSAFSDIPVMLNRSRRMITNVPGYSQMQNFVAFFSDGMANCRASGSPRCNPSDENYFKDSIDLSLLELDAYERDKITLHMFLFGEQTMPHELAWNVDGRCGSAEEVRALGYPTVDITGSFNALGTVKVNTFFSRVALTGGLWAPIRDCVRNNSGTCVPFDAASFNGACAGINSASRAAALAANTSGGVVSGGNSVLPANSFWDSRGRITKDPLGRTVAQQVNDYMNIVLAKPPYVLASPSCRIGGTNYFENSRVPCCNGKTTANCS